MEQTHSPVLQIEGVSKAYPGDAGPTEVLRNVTLTLARGETLALTGESGSGKSTLLHLAAGLETPDSGHVSVLGRDITQLNDADRAAIRRDQVSIVFQQFNLIPSLTVADNISFQARLAGRGGPDEFALLAQRLGLADHLGKYPEQLSGGQQQRTAIARALAARPALVLADEPTGNLDEALGEEVITLMLDLVAETGTSLLMVTHSTQLADRLGRRLHLSRGALHQ